MNSRAWKQTSFRDGFFKSESIVPHLYEQSRQLLTVEQKLPVTEEPPVDEQEAGFLFKDEVAKIDFDLIRYSCSFLADSLDEAARDDCAQLIANSILAKSDGEATTSWRRWLERAPCWPGLTTRVWSSARAAALKLLITELEQGNESIPENLLGDITKTIVQLKIEDLLDAEDWVRLFGEDTAADENEGTDREQW